MGRSRRNNLGSSLPDRWGSAFADAEPLRGGIPKPFRAGSSKSDRDRIRKRGIPRHRERGISPIVGVVLLIAITLVLAGAVAVGIGSIGQATTGEGGPSPTDRATLQLSVDAESGTISFVHRAGDPIDVGALELRIAVDDEPLTHQPPLPFFSAEGFVSGPTGPFNSETSDTWRVGERPTLQVAGTNEPAIESGSTVTVTVVHEEVVIDRLETTAT